MIDFDGLNVGAAPNDGTGDSLRDAFIKVRDNYNLIDIGMWRISPTVSEHLSGVNTYQNWFGAAPVGVTLEPGIYQFEGLMKIIATASFSHYVSAGFAGTATFTIAYTVVGSKSDTVNQGGAGFVAYSRIAAPTVAHTPTDTGRFTSLNVFGTVRVTAAGTFIPQFKLSASTFDPVYSEADNFFNIRRIGDIADTNRGWA